MLRKKFLRKKILLVMGLSLLCSGVVLGGQSLMVPLKARLSVFLIDRAWDKTLHGEPDARPWPWMDSAPVARLYVPRLNRNFVVMRGTSGAVMAFSPGWNEGTALPGMPGISLISAHRDTHFGFLKTMKEGDTLELTDNKGHVHHYRVDDIIVSQSAEVSVPTGNNDEILMLSTCYPFSNWQRQRDMRFIVVARKVEDARGGPERWAASSI